MKFAPLHASLLALAVVAAASSAHAANAATVEAGLLRLAQADTGEAPTGFEQIVKFLARGADVSRLDDERLQQRLSRAKRLQQTEGLPPDLAAELDQQIAAMTAEIERRQQAAAEAPAAQPDEQPKQQVEEQPQPQQQAEEQPQPKPRKQVAEEAAPPQESAEAAAFLNAVRPAAGLSEEELRQQMEQASALAQTEGLSQEQRRALRDVIREARAELRSKEAGGQQAGEAPPQPEEQQPQQQAQPEQPKQAEQQAAQEAAPQPPQESGEVAAFLASVKPASELSEEALREQMRRATELAGTEGLAPEQRRALRDVIREARAALRNQPGGSQQTGEQAQPETQPQQQQQQQAQPEQPQPPAAQEQAVQVDPELESRAQAILNDTTDVSTMDRREMRQRLRGIRDLLASDRLSPQTKEALRQKLAAERQVLRKEVSESEDKDTAPQGGAAKPAEGKPQDQAQDQMKGQGGGTPQNNNVTINNTTTNTTTVTNTEVRVVLQDRRPPDALDDAELVRRIDVYRDVVDDERYAEEERRAWRRALERDRRYLRRQMLEERQARAEELRRGQIEFDIDIEDDYVPGRDVPDDVFAAEVEDEELVDVLAAPPRRKVERRYTVEEIERSSEARDAVARIEIDTVHFGFGEGFLREEEIDKLDRIAQVLEKILAKNPEEVFLLEGHTDAVGSDASNLALSRQRAQAVKDALTTYYVIPKQNLKTVGLGERYLKIPTQQAEAENRRVSLARITPLVGQLD